VCVPGCLQIRTNPLRPESANLSVDGGGLRSTAFRNSSLQGAYLIIALRPVGLDCGAMSGFDNAKVDAAFFPDGRLKSNFLINIGYGTGEGIPPRNPPLHFRGAVPDSLNSYSRR